MPRHDLRAAARAILRETGFEVELTPAQRRQLEALPDHLPEDTRLPSPRDLRHLPWSSIDNSTTLDVDQIEAAERLPSGETRLWVGIADVDCLVPLGSPLDHRAATNTVSVYAGEAILPMLPERLSEDRTSLRAGKDRLALVAEFVVCDDGRCRDGTVYRAVVANRAQLEYQSVGAFLAGKGAEPKPAKRAKLGEQLRLQGEAAERLRRERDSRGALELDTVEARPVLDHGRVVDIEVTPKGRARDLIEDLMIAANETIAGFLEAHDVAWIRRQVRAPERWGRIVELAAKQGGKLPPRPDRQALAAFLRKRRRRAPKAFRELSLAVVKLLGSGSYIVEHRGEDLQGHFALAVPDYTHFTAPNRRFADLVTQRLVKAVLAGETPPYADGVLDDVARRCTQMEDLANKVERRLRKVAAADLVEGRIGKVFDAIVTGASPKGTWVRTRRPAVEGRVMRGQEGLDVGEHVRVRLVKVDRGRGYIDFETARR